MHNSTHLNLDILFVAQNGIKLECCRTALAKLPLLSVCNKRAGRSYHDESNVILCV